MSKATTIVWFSCLALLGAVSCISRNIYSQSSFRHRQEINGDAGEPLILTPLIKSGQLEKARNLSRVGDVISKNIVSHSGFLTVDDKYDSNMFFWYFPATSGNAEKKPLLLWLQGGPGGTDMFGLFVEVGPLKVFANSTIIERDIHWAKNYNLLFIDNPVGTGFSFTKNDKGYCNNEVQVGKNLYSALQQFLTLFPNLRKNEFYLTGESYAGKYIPAIAYTIHNQNKLSKSAPKINLKGMAIGDGLIDPVNQLNYGDLLYQFGLLDENQKREFHKRENNTKTFIENKNYLGAFNEFDKLLNGDKFKYGSVFYNYTGLKFYFNILNTFSPPEFAYFNKLFLRSDIRKAIHVGNVEFSDGSLVETHLLGDVMKSVKDWLAVLLDNDYKILLFNGQLDVIVAPVLTENFLQKLNWKHASEYKKVKRTIYKVDPSDTQVAGYVRNVGNFYQIVVRNAGHILPYDQPRIAFDMITRFVDGKGFK